MKYLYDFKNHQVLMAEEAKTGYEAIPAEAFNAYFETQGNNAGSGLYFRKIKNRLELVRRNGDEPVDVDAANLSDVVWIDGQGFLPPQPTVAHTWDGEKWVADQGSIAKVQAETLATLKTDLCAKIDARAMAVGDAQIKGSVYLSSEYQRNASEAAAWANSGFVGAAPASILVGAESHGITAQAEAELILRESAMAEGLIETLRAWRMNAKGLNGIQGATTVEAAQAVFDAAMVDLDRAMGKGR